MSVTYVRIAMTLWSNNIPSENGSMPTDPALSGSSSSGSNNQMTNQVMARRNVAKMLIVVVIAFAVCYMPIHCANFLRYLKVGIEEHPELMSGLWFIAHWLCYFNSAVNPIIYNFMSAKFRMEFAETCRICCCCTSSCPIRLSNRGMNTVRNQSLNSLKYTVNNTQVDQFTLSTFNTDDGKKKLCQRSILRNAHPLQ
ncbi:hypothetical protein HELRODRAFT_189892 [Helobdella robusta]|uniref:G-protein coupled receptors family 1 profile domain-containing protein n=1 Tax=Helobdella robusta TaxID=6412 RepID=T1FRG4_HELRO|nr:hypothetical protein HELRODRAFT_189892 [Helobdella robusta]ESN90546.1 hypothetical protein HELRODRAFT_189892 [Helobdella robusta]